MNTNAHANRGAKLALAGGLALGSMIVVLAISGTREGHAAAGHQHGDGAAMAAQTTKQLAFHDGMRELWEQHVAWTRLAIVSFASSNADLAATEGRLLRNQVDIGNAIKPFYGKAAGNQLTKLLKEHITGAVAILVAAKAGDNAKLAHAKTAWYANGREVADFLSAANRSNWPRAMMRSMMKTHLDQTLGEAVSQLTGHYAAGVRQYDAIEQHISQWRTCSRMGSSSSSRTASADRTAASSPATDRLGRRALFAIGHRGSWTYPSCPTRRH